jgi:hypothetical protein
VDVHDEPAVCFFRDDLPGQSPDHAANDITA